MMNPKLKNILAVVGGFVLGSIVNMCIIMVSGKIIPPPLGADTTTMQGLKATMHLFETKHFLMPFLAHALGALIGAAIAAIFGISNQMKLAIAVGLLFLLGGTANIFMLPSPTWFIIVDIALAYLPMAFLGYLLAKKIKNTI
jgi:hypothetical protein